MATEQLAYAPARAEGDAPDTAPRERDGLRLPRQRGAVPARATLGAAGLAPSRTEPAPGAAITLTDGVPGAPLTGTPTYDPAAVAGARTATAATAAPVAVPLPPAAEARVAVPLPPAVDVPAVTAPPAVEDEPADAEQAEGHADPGAALCARLLGQVAAQREAAARAVREEAERVAAAQAAREAAERRVREQAAAAKAAAEAKAREEAEAAARAEAERLARLAASYIKPVACATLGAAFGEADPWGNFHAGQDFTAPTGTPVHAVHGGTVSSAGWAGSFGYRVVVTLDDGTQVWYCHLSTVVATEGRVTTGDTVGRVGATGNIPSPHLHLEVRPDGGAPVDPLEWLRAHDADI